jgi:hypothetical protein
MRHYLLIAILILFSCNSNQQQVKSKPVKINNDKCHIYPSAIDSLHAQDLYDSARWFIYTWHCDMPYLPKVDSLRIGTFGELELRFNRVFYKNNTLDIDFYFIDNGESVLTGSTRDTRELATGVRFDFAAKRKLAMLSRNSYSIQVNGEKSRYENPLQPEVISYIKGNWDKLDDCFRKLVEQKGIRK